MMGALADRLRAFQRQFHIEVVNEMQEVGKDIRREFKGVVDDWEHKPTFTSRVIERPRYIRAEVLVGGQHKQIWRYVDEGTRPHVILPRKEGGRLIFRTGYSPRTLPIAQAHVGTGIASGNFVSVQQVNHPGTEARDFGKQIAEDYKPEFRRRIENAFRRAARR